MATAAVLSRIVLAVVFATAGVGKLLDLAGSRQAMRDFGVPDRFTGPAGLLLPLAELTIAATLVLRPTAQWAAVAAFVLVLTFIAGIANAMRHGVAPDCHCFGQLHSAPAGRETLVRNGVLAVITALVVVEGSGPAFDTWVNARSAAELAAVGASGAALVLGVLLLQTWTRARQLSEALGSAQRQIALAPAGLPVGVPAPSFDLRGLRADRVSLDQLLDPGRPVLLVFASPGCGSCLELFPNIRRWQQTLRERLTIAIISAGEAKDNQPLADRYGFEEMLMPDGMDMLESYRIRATPSAVLVNPDGTIASVPAESAFGIEPLVRLVLRNGTPAERNGRPGEAVQGAVA